MISGEAKARAAEIDAERDKAYKKEQERTAETAFCKRYGICPHCAGEVTIDKAGNCMVSYSCPACAEEWSLQI